MCCVQQDATLGIPVLLKPAVYALFAADEDNLQTVHVAPQVRMHITDLALPAS